MTNPRGWFVAVVIPFLLVGCLFDLPDQPDAAMRVCLGSSDGIVKPCFATAPVGDLELAANLDTGSSSLCSTVVTGADGLCVIAANAIRIHSIVKVIGARPLVLVADTEIEISAMLDVGSHVRASEPFDTVQVGAGSVPPGGCSPGTLPLANGGGAGGSFGHFGGDGGNSGGFSAPPRARTTLPGGCWGQKGVTGTSGEGGRGGGAVYLIADVAILIKDTGSINASGEGGHPGIAGSAGGGGGGSGGMIGLDAPTIVNDGVVYANGGSGGEGSDVTVRGNPGREPTGTDPAPPPDSNTPGGGDGGCGGAGGTTGGDPEGCHGGDAAYGGGGGGGGAGAINVYRGTLPGRVSPTPNV